MCIQTADSKPNGIFSVDFTYDKNNIPNPTEINIAKFFTTHHFITKTGCNMPEILVKLAFEEYDGPYDIRNPCDDYMYWIRGMDIIPKLVSKEDIDIKSVEFEQIKNNMKCEYER